MQLTVRLSSLLGSRTRNKQKKNRKAETVLWKWCLNSATLLKFSLALCWIITTSWPNSLLPLHQFCLFFSSPYAFCFPFPLGWYSNKLWWEEGSKSEAELPIHGELEIAYQDEEDERELSSIAEGCMAGLLLCFSLFLSFLLSVFFYSLFPLLFALSLSA